jgi:opacity protein-like surface antigen
MNRTSAALLLGSLALAGIAPTVTAQSVWVGGGAGIPTSDFKNGVKTGWLANAGLMIPTGAKGLSASVEGYYGSNKWKVAGTGKSDLIAGLVSLGYAFMPDGKFSPYIFGGGGILNSKAKPTTGTSVSKSKAAYQFGGGVSFQVAPTIWFWADARYLGTGGGTGKLTMIPITAGLSFDLKKK